MKNIEKNKNAERLHGHYLNNKTLRITDSMQPIYGKVYKVTGKVEARKLCKQLKATPWNF